MLRRVKVDGRLGKIGLMLLTIGVPTYNRAASVSSLLHHLLADAESLPVKVMVIDDGSDDDTYDSLSADALIAPRVQLLKNDTNLGYPQTFARAFQVCETEYLMLLADDDLVVVENLSLLVEYLGREQPAFVSPQFMRGETIYRGQDQLAPITPDQFLEASAHASGLIYRVRDCRAPLAELAERVNSKRADALIYPQVVILVQLLIAAKRCEWFALPTASEGSLEPSGIRDADGNAYWSVESRWQQLKAFESLLTQYAESDTTGVAQEILNALHANVYSILGSAMRSESQTLAAAFDRGVRNNSKRVLSNIRSMPIFKWTSRKT